MEYHHLSQIVYHKALQLGDREVLKTRNKATGDWSSISWNDFSKKSTSVAHSMCHFGVAPQSNVGVFTQNMAECFYIDFGAFANRATVVPMYATASVPQITYMIEEAEIQLLFVGEQQQYDKAWQVFQTGNTLKQIVILDNSVTKAPLDKTSIYFDYFSSLKNRSSQDMSAVEKRMKEAKSDDVAHIIYTSGTTGIPKGAALTHSNYLEAFRLHDIRMAYLPKPFLSISFLPMAHIFEKAWSILCLYWGCSIAINQDPKEITTSIKEIKPEAMCGVPRFWEKVYAGVQEKIENANFIFRALYSDAVSTGKKYNLYYINKGKKPPVFLKWKYHFYSSLVYSKLKKVLGIEKGIIFPCAGAMLSETIVTFLRSVDIPLVMGYGLTETTATVSFFPPLDFEIGTVGQVMPELEIRIGENNEIQLKGKTIMKEYYKKPQETAAAFTEDGWFRTGDAGSLTKKNGIILTERIKDLYKTSNGKYIAPQQLEGRLLDDKYIDSAIIIGDQRKYVTALIVPAFDELKKYASEHEIQFENTQDLCKNKAVIELYRTRIKPVQNEFANYEQLKRFTLLPEPFSIDTGELTNTLKMKRAFIAEKFKSVIDKMYEE